MNIVIREHYLIYINHYSQDVEVTPPDTSSTSRPIDYAPPSETPYIGHNAPSLKDVAEGRVSKRKAKTVKVTSRKRLAKGSSSSPQPANPAVAAQLLAASFQVNLFIQSQFGLVTAYNAYTMKTYPSNRHSNIASIISIDAIGSNAFAGGYTIGSSPCCISSSRDSRSATISSPNAKSCPSNFRSSSSDD
jgi:hypothetical protein